MTLNSQSSATEPIPDLQFRLFGPITVRVHGENLPPLHSRKGIWLLALLVLKQPRPVDRTWIAATLWPDSDRTESLTNLRNTLSDLRRALGQQAKRIQAPTPGTLHLDLSGADGDLPTFDASVKSGDPAALTEAVSLYRGALLEGCDEEWVVLEREQRQQACLDALESLAGIELQAGRAAKAAAYLRTCIGIDAFRETAQCALMNALATVGDYAGVTQVFRAFRLLLHEELHTQPAGETVALYQMIRIRARQVAAGGAASLRSQSQPGNLPAGAEQEEIDEASYAPSAPHNIPPPLTSFIGREKECADVKALLAQSRLLTLTGAGGSGKTRLSLEVATEMIGVYTDGVWLVELAALSDPALVVQAVASALDIRERAGEPLLQTLMSTQKSKSMLLILDNCEHLLGACSELAAGLLRGCPSVRLLATSRERLGIAGEQIYRVTSLSLPDLTAEFDVKSIDQFESIRLFVARACLVHSEFRVGPHNAAAVAQVCLRLDGIPLAIELAAARVRSLPVEELHRRLDDRFHLLTGGDRSALPRQQTLRGLIDWSYDLLSDPEKCLLQRLSVFAGGWTLEAAESVAGRGEEVEEKRENGWDVLDLLTSLVDKSLVLCEERDGRARYRLLETVLQYARDRLAEREPGTRTRERHRDYFLRLAEVARPQLTGSEQLYWLGILDVEHENLRAAVTYCLEDPDGAEAGLRIGAALQPFWDIRGRLSEGRQHLNAVLSRPTKQAYLDARADALNGGGLLARIQGDYNAARPMLQESLAIYRKLGNKQGSALCLNNLGVAAQEQGDYAVAHAMYEENLAIFRELNEKRGIASSLNNLGIVAFCQGNYAAAGVLYDESLTFRRELGDKKGSAIALSNLGNAAHAQGDTVMARARYEQSLKIYHELGDKQGSARCLHNMGILARDQGDYPASLSLLVGSLMIRQELGEKRGVASSLDEHASLNYYVNHLERAAKLWGASTGLREAIGALRTPAECEEYEKEVAGARAALGGAAFDAALVEGRAMTWEQAVEMALSERV